MKSCSLDNFSTWTRGSVFKKSHNGSVRRTKSVTLSAVIQCSDLINSKGKQQMKVLYILLFGYEPIQSVLRAPRDQQRTAVDASHS